jgi:predicted GNAT family N-acyltransferase
MLNNSDLIFGMCEAESQNLVAFARILTDRVYRAMIFDVIVGANYRDRGLGAILIERILSHPELSQVECIHLFCLPDVIPFYEKFGFVLAEPSLLVRKRIEN